MIETDIMRAIQVAASKSGNRLFRNNVAVGWVGHLANKPKDGIVVLKNARALHAGLCVGSSDLIGFTRDGRFLAIEVKTDTGRATQEQRQFIAIVREFGGYAGIARSVQDAIEITNGIIHD